MVNKILLQEKEVTDHLMNAWELFCQLEQTHPCHGPDFCDGIHKCQQIIMWRECQRNNPEKYPMKI
jgi:hypothetical protein